MTSRLRTRDSGSFRPTTGFNRNAGRFAALARTTVCHNTDIPPIPELTRRSGFHVTRQHQAARLYSTHINLASPTSIRKNEDQRASLDLHVKRIQTEAERGIVQRFQTINQGGTRPLTLQKLEIDCVNTLACRNPPFARWEMTEPPPLGFTPVKVSLTRPPRVVPVEDTRQPDWDCVCSNPEEEVPKRREHPTSQRQEST